MNTFPNTSTILTKEGNICVSWTTILSPDEVDSVGGKRIAEMWFLFTFHVDNAFRDEVQSLREETCS